MINWLSIWNLFHCPEQPAANHVQNLDFSLTCSSKRYDDANVARWIKVKSEFAKVAFITAVVFHVVFLQWTISFFLKRSTHLQF